MYCYDHGGDIYAGKGSKIDFSVNVNPLGMPESVKYAATEAISDCGKYPDHDCRRLKEAIALRYGTDPETVICGNGASDIIYRLFAALSPRVTLLTAPTFSEYEKAAHSIGGFVKHHSLSEDSSFEVTESILDVLTSEVKLVFLCNPNNPSGRLTNRELLVKIMDTCIARDIFIAVDECFLELSEGWGDSLVRYVKGNKKLFILRAFTKDYAIPGLRLGYGFCSDTGLIDKMKNTGQPWSVSIPAEAAGTAACGEIQYLETSREFIRRERKKLTDVLRSLNLKVIDSDTNFILFKAPGRFDLKERMLEHGILVRSSSGFFGLTDDYYRVAVRTEKENKVLIAALAEVIR